MVFTSLLEQPPEYLSVNRVICFLEVDKEVVSPPPASMHLIEESASMDSSGFALLEPCLVCFGGDQMWAGLLDLVKDRFLHYFGDV